MRYLLIFVCSTICLSVFAQQNSPIQLEWDATLGWGNRTFVAESSKWEEVTDDYKDRAESDLNYSTGLRLNYSLGEKWMLSGGVRYAELRYKLGNDESALTPPDQTPDPSIPVSVEEKFSNKFLVIPVLAGYKITLSEKLQLRILAGVKNNIHLSNSRQFIVKNASGVETTETFENEGDINTYALSAALESSLSYTWNEHLSLLGGVEATYFVTQLYDSSVVRQYPFWGGIKLGVGYQF